VEDDDVAAVTAVLRSEWLTEGPALATFEDRIISRCGAAYGVGLSSATAGLHAACHAIGIGPGDRVWTSPNSFVASANCAVYCGGYVDFVDIDPYSYMMSPIELERKLTAARKEGTLPKALIVVHFGGQPCDLEAIAALAKPYGISLIEDASHALGATYRGESVGNCRYSDATVLSFQATKSIATGEGGMVLTNRENIRDNVRLFRGHGITREPAKMRADLQAEPWKYEQIDLGFNYRMTDVQAALGTSQLAKLDAFLERRRELAARYDEALAGLQLQLPYRDTASTSAWHLYAIQILAPQANALRLALYQTLLQRGIKSQVNYIPIHTQPYYQAHGFHPGDYPAAESYYARALSLPLFFDLDRGQQDRVVEIVRSIVPASP